MSWKRTTNFSKKNQDVRSNRTCCLFDLEGRKADWIINGGICTNQPNASWLQLERQLLQNNVNDDSVQFENKR